MDAHLDGNRLWIAAIEGIVAVDPFPLYAQHLNIHNMGSSWKPVFLDVDFRCALDLVHRVHRRPMPGHEPDEGQDLEGTTETEAPSSWDSMLQRVAEDLRQFVEYLGPSDCVRAGTFGDLHFPLLFHCHRSRDFGELIDSNEICDAKSIAGLLKYRNATT